MESTTGPIIDNQTQDAAPKPIEAMTDDELNQLEQSALSEHQEAPAPVEDKPAKPEEPPPPTLEKIVSDQKTFIGRQASEIGELRKQVAQLQQMMLEQKQPKQDAPQPKDPAAENEEFFKAPIEKIQAILDEREKKRQETEQADVQARRANKEKVFEAVPDFDNIVQDVFAVLLSDGFPEEQVIEFAKNPWREKPEALIALAKRARAERRLRELEQGKPEAKPQEAPKPKVTAPKNPITSTVGQSRSGDRTTYLNGLTDMDIAKMSDEELNSILKKAQGG